jgi:integrase/recombinase XerD
MAGQANLAVIDPPRRSPLDELVDDYLASCRARGLADGTLGRAYRFSLESIFLPWCATNGVIEPSELTQRILDRFTSHLYEKGGRSGKPLSKYTIHTYGRHVRQFLAWAAREGEVSADAKPQLPRLSRKVLDVLTRREIDQLEGAATDERNKLMVRILADSGVRLGELCGLTTDPIRRDGRRAFLKIRGKAEHERLVPIPPDLTRRIERFVRGRSHNAKGDRLFLSSRRGRDGRYAPLTDSGVEQFVRGLAYRAGITKRVYPHIFRHSYATEALRRGMNPVLLAAILGHSSLRMIDSVYAHMNTTDAYDAMLKMFSDADY